MEASGGDRSAARQLSPHVGASEGATAGVHSRVGDFDSSSSVAIRARGFSLSVGISPGFVRLRRPSHFLLTPGILPSAPSGPPSAFAPLLRRSASPKKGDPDEGPSLREGSRRAWGVSRRYIRRLLLRCSTSGIHALALYRRETRALPATAPALLYLGHPCPRLCATLRADPPARHRFIRGGDQDQEPRQEQHRRLG
jgi:hypothetical protein